MTQFTLPAKPAARPPLDAGVIASMAKWPNVPDCYGWLHLDAQGRWLLGEWGRPLPNSTPSIVEHEGLKQFINRNYLQAHAHRPVRPPIHADTAQPAQICDNQGAWALQNGPQRVWATLALAPLIITLHCGTATAHTGQVVQIQAVYLADDGVVYFATSAGAAALASRSMETFASGVLPSDAPPLDNAAPSVDFWQADPSTVSSPALPIQHCAALDVEALLGFQRQARST
jgi:Protein of unknown function (DUF2946)